jgi:hypothetical protein
MKKFEFLHGRWEGIGKLNRGPEGSGTARVVEVAEPKLEGAILSVEGLGRDEMDPNQIVHHAYGIIHYDRRQGGYRIRAYRSDGSQVDAEVKLVDRGFDWGFSPTPGFQVLYKMRINEKGQWHETGEMSRDEGKTWMPFFEMTLDKAPDAKPVTP